jgi:hypothetical protein
MELEASWPIPIRDHGAEFAFFYFARFGPPPAEVDQLYPPQWFAVISAQTGELVSLEKRHPEAFGNPGPADRPFAEHTFPAHWTPEIMDAIKAELTGLSDTLTSAWFSGVGAAPSGRVAARFRDLFPNWVAPPLVPSYRFVSPAYFDWVGLY